MGQMVKRPSTVRETWVRSLGQEDALEKEMATHSSILAWRIPWAEEPCTMFIQRVTKLQKEPLGGAVFQD